ncbi:hypothetical protein DNU06_06520 [Putridiphycobacter roseus]|uniref:Transglutaminase-like domain-containing protein n=1 Tax=Putridiphycobacter roseus TaxID=2219161 RepID=A0A2W1MZW4_9FLAO|nr:transglutaminase family protein [Putridiphycobacter roseus]PZE17477.1 hypothetical protein DNU06_06520 [Putridiphycobacter roseus]
MVSDKEEGTPSSNAYSIILLGFIAGVLTIPAFIFLYKYFPSIEINVRENPIRLDHMILFLVLFFVIFYLLKKLRVLILIIVFAGAIILTATNFMNLYTLENLYHDYKALLYDISNNTIEQKFFTNEVKFFKEEKLREAVDYLNPVVRNYAVNVANKHFSEDRILSPSLKWVHFFSIFKEVHEKWNYVYDPHNEDYYAKASETIEQLKFDNQFKGDCDDHAILMGAIIKAVGGEVRLVKTRVSRKDGSTVGHMYPEVKFGDVKELEAVVYLIKNIYFPAETKGKNINYYQDNKGFIWLNFDYNDNYPGGAYQSNIRESEVLI